MSISKRTLRQSINYILGVILVILCTLVAIILGIYVGLFRKDTIVSLVQESNYYMEVHQEIYHNADTILESSIDIEQILGSDSVENTTSITSILDRVITLERVYIASKEYIGYRIDNPYHEDTEEMEVLISTKGLTEELYTQLISLLESKNITITKELDTGIKEIVTKVEKEYVRGIQFQFIQYLSLYRYEYQQQIRWILPVLLAGIFLLIGVILGISRYIHRGLRYITCSVIASTGLVLLLSLLCKVTRWQEPYEVMPLYYQRFIQSFGKASSNGLIYMGIIGVGVSLLLIMITKVLKQRMLSKGSK